MTAVPAVTGNQVRAYRILVPGLDRAASHPRKLPLWDLGIQDRDGSTRLALDARLADPTAVPDLPDPGSRSWSALVWSLRGSPHLHRRADLGRISAALWPAGPADAKARLSGDAGRLLGDGADPLEAFAVVADGMREVITSPMVKGEASAAVTAALPAEFSGFCPGCDTVHVRELLFRLAALPAGLGLVPDTKPVVLAPLSGSSTRPDEQQGLADVASQCYRQFGVGTPSDVGAHLGTSAAGIRPALPDDLVPVTVDGMKSRVPASLLGSIVDRFDEAAAGITRLLPPSYPRLQPLYRAAPTTDAAQRKELWPVIGAPSALLADGGIAGTWRTRASSGALTITVNPWRTLRPAEQAMLKDEAQLVGQIRAAKRTTLVFG